MRKKGPFGRWCKKRIVAAARGRLILFKYLHASDFDAKHRLLPRARHLEVRLAAIKLWEDVIERIMNPMLILARLIQIGAPLIIALWFHSNPSWNWLIYILLYEVTAFSSYYLIIVLPVILLSSYSLAQWFWLVILLFASTTGIYQIASAVGNSTDNMLPAFLASVMLGLLSVIIAIIINGILVAFGRITRNTRYPDAVLVDGFLEILYMVETKPGKWIDLNFKRQLVNKIEEAALCVQNNLPRRLRSGDAGTDAWLKNTTNEIAAGLRELKKSVLLSMPSARTQFVADISTSIINATSGNWAEIKKANPEEFPITQNWRVRVVEWLRTIFAGVGPLVLVWLIQQPPLNLPGEPLRPLIILTVLWAMLTLLTKADPFYRDKIGALKDLVPLLPMTGKDKK
jgi:hypothetical protein